VDPSHYLLRKNTIVYRTNINMFLIIAGYVLDFADGHWPN